MIPFLLSPPFLVLFGVILLMIIFKSRFHSATEFLEKLKKRNTQMTNNH